MKRLLSVLALTLVLVLALASCDIIYGVIGMHTVTFDLNGGAVSADFEETVNVFDGKCVNELPVPTKDEYVFDGWYYGEELFTTETAVTGDITLVAKWHPCKVKLSFVDHLGNLIKEETVDYGSSVIPPAVDAIIGNQKFVKWDKDLSSVTEDMVVKAIYEDNVFTITYDCGDITESFTEKSFVGQLPTVPAIPTVDGHVFCGWYLDAELTERYFFDFNIDNDITLYAKFYDTSLGEYIVISNVDQLKAISEEPDAKYLLACDINCKGEELTIIDEFNGELDGNSYKIFNFALSVDESNVAFIRTNNGTVKNLSFASFVFDVYVGMVGNHYYAVVCGINNGTVENCHTLDSEMLVSDSLSGGDSAVFVGALVGYNKTGVINDCSNNTILNITLDKTNSVYNGSIKSYAGGICGWNDTDATVINVINYVNVTARIISRGGQIQNEVAGIIGHNKGSVKQSANFGDVSVDTEDAGNFIVSIYAAGAVANNNNGKIENCYVQCSVSVDNAANRRNLNLIGGFAAKNNGKIYNCYSVVDIKDSTAKSIAIGGFVAYHEQVQGNDSYINKSFALGSIEITGETGNIGQLVGYSNANITDSYYSNDFTINKKIVSKNELGESVETLEPVEPTAAYGSAKATADILTLEFIANELYFDRDVWFVYDGELPVLR